MGKRVVIIGGVATGMKTASRLRRRDKDAEIIVLERGPQLSYGACGFPYFIGRDVKDFAEFDHTPQGIARDAEYFRAYKGIDARTGCNVTAINPQEKTVVYTELATGKEFILSYDVLVLGTGSTPVKLPLANADAAGIHSFWFPWDVQAVDREIDERKVTDVVIIGAGFVGIELAEAFHKRGLKTSVVEMQDRVLGQMLDKEMADLIRKPLEKAGISLCLEEKTVGFTAENGIVTGVQTDKRLIPAQLVIVAVGVRPNVELAKAAGLAIGPSGCIAVNEYLQTSDENIYAGGDCAENTHRVSGAKIFTPMGSTANKHGRVIADNICGDKIKYPGVLTTGICQVLDWQAGSTGLNERTAAAAGFKFKTVVVPGNDRLGYMPGVKSLVLKLIAEEGTERVLGVQAVGRGGVDKRIDTLVAAISMGATLEDLSNFDIAYAPPFNGPIDNIATAANVLHNKMTGQMRSINPKDFKAQKADDNYLLVDVRTAEEFNSKSIAGVKNKINIPLGEMRCKCKELTDKNIKIITTCQIDLRGYEAEVMLRCAGCCDVQSLEGGMSAWPYEVESNKK